MIIVKLMGGLGNQMFQYAAGRRLAAKHNTELKLDISFLSKKPNGWTPRSFELQHLNINPVLANVFEVATFTGCGPNILLSLMVRLWQVIGLFRAHYRIFNESVYHYDALFENLFDNTYLIGYWQSERYFAGIESLLRKEFSVINPIDTKNRELLERINSCNSVSVHVRRGDYISNPNAAQYHGTCGIDYYRLAVDRIGSLVSQAAFFVFSDDPIWSREHLGFIPNAEFVDVNGANSGANDLRLMSNCQHHIIANSSFSWWGAWLGGNPAKRVIAPSQWYIRDNIDTTYLCPTYWIRI